MQQDIPHLTGDIETIAELRELYRAAETRAARLRLLSTSGRELLQAEADSIDPILKKSADRLAQFLGSRSANMTRDNATPGFPIILPGCGVAVHSTLLVAGFSSLADIDDPEDREACQTLLDMMGAASVLGTLVAVALFVRLLLLDALLRGALRLQLSKLGAQPQSFTE